MKKHTFHKINALLLSLLMLLVSTNANAAMEGIIRVSVASDGTQGDGNSRITSIYSGPALSTDGRYIAFESSATNLVSGDTNGYSDIFVKNLRTGIVRRVSVNSSGTQGNDDLYGVSISGDGRYISFLSHSNNLVAGDTNGMKDIFLHDVQTETTIRVSVASDGTQSNGQSLSCSISADGNYVAFEFAASNLVNADLNGKIDIFIHNLQNGITSLISLATDGITQGNEKSYDPSISGDGRFVVFVSNASTFVIGDSINNDVFVNDRNTGITTIVSKASNGSIGDTQSNEPEISQNGRFITYTSYNDLVSGDSNHQADVYLYDMLEDKTTLVSVSSTGMQGDSSSFRSSVSTNGRYVVFVSGSDKLVDGDTNWMSDVFIHDMLTGETSRLSEGLDGAEPNWDSGFNSISADGNVIAFESGANNLVIGDTNGLGVRDVFIRNRVLFDFFLPFIKQ